MADEEDDWEDRVDDPVLLHVMRTTPPPPIGEYLQVFFGLRTMSGVRRLGDLSEFCARYSVSEEIFKKDVLYGEGFLDEITAWQLSEFFGFQDPGLFVRLQARRLRQVVKS